MDGVKAQRLEQAITEAVRASKASSKFHGVSLDDTDLEDDIVYRVGLKMDALDDLSDDDLTDLVRSIEEAVEDIDPRVPSVSFLEAV
jgi:predicted Zn-dependent protease